MITRFPFLLTIACLLLIALSNTFSLQAQTPEAPVLRCVNLLPDGTVALEWMPGSGSPVTVCSSAGAGSPFAAYEIFVSADGTNFTLLTAINDPNQTEFIDNISNTSTVLYYYVTTICGLVTSPPSSIVDTQDPVAPVISSITVQDNSTTTLSWQPSVSPETYGYIIYRADANGNFTVLDTVFVSDLPAGAILQTYNDLDAQPAQRAESYKIAAIDSCTLEPGPDNNVPHTTIRLQTDGDECAQSINMSWSAYQGWTVDHYEIALADGTNIVELPASTFTYNYPLPAGTNNACLIVKAISVDGVTTSLSNTVCTTVDAEQQPDYIYLTNISVTADNKVAMTWLIDTATPLNTLRIMRGIGDTTNLAEHEFYNIPSPLTPEMLYTDDDNDVRADRYSFVYQVMHTDPCNHQFFSTIGKTILLDGQDNLNGSNGLDWSAFYLTHADILNYNIYRADSIDGAFSLIGTVGNNVLTYDDVFGTSGNLSDQYCYYVEATYTMALPTGNTITGISRSNIVCINQTSRIFVPNAFLPNGVNNVFKPVLVFPNEAAYSMVVINRWGEIVFKTDSPDEGWNGEYKNDLAPQDTYAYVIQMTTLTGYQIERKGTVTLIR
jgi:gliding motility-associated-like protein